MNLRKSAISRLVAVAVLIVIVAAAVGAYYLAAAPSPIASTTGSSTSSSSTTSTPTSLIPTTSSTTSSSSSSAPSTNTISSSTSSTHSQTSSGTQTQTITATCSSTTANSATSTVLALIPWLNSYPSMTLTFSGKTSTMTSTKNLSMYYSVVSVTATTYTVDFNYVGNKTHAYTAWLLKNGTTLAIYNGQMNVTGAQAGSKMQDNFGEFAAVQGFLQEQSLYTNLFHSNGTSTVTIGTQSFTVTNYVANALPETVQLCNGETDVLAAYNLSEGTPNGATYELPTYVNISGSTTSSGTQTPFAFTVEITAFTVA